jgi:uncharacterized protein YkwD
MLSPSKGCAMPNIKTLARLILFTSLLLLPTQPASADSPVPGVPPAITWETPGPRAAAIIDVAAAGCSQPFCIYLPATHRSPTWVQTQDRQASLAFYLDQYLSSENVPADWTGNHASCSAGTTSAEFRSAVLRRINYFRSMAGVPGLRALSDTYNLKAQAAALMMSVNRQLSHNPPSTWTCYTSEGAQGAGSSNLYLGVYGPAAISGYIKDPGSGNSAAGHRRWILFPPTQQMGTGDIPPVVGYLPSNALWVFDAFSPRPATREPYVAWPPPGYVPYPVVFARWSFSYPNADLTAATVTMQSGGASLGLSQSPVVNGYGDNTLVWTPAGAAGDSWPKPAQDTTYTVSVQNVFIGGQNRGFTYDVILFDPGL